MLIRAKRGLLTKPKYKVLTTEALKIKEKITFTEH